MSVHQTYDGRWICVYKGPDSKRHDKSFGRGPDAEAGAKAFDEAMRSREIVPVVEQPTGPILRQAVDAYLDHLRAQGKSQSHISNVQYMANSLLYPYFGSLMPLAMMTYANGIVPFINHLRVGMVHALGYQLPGHPIMLPLLVAPGLPQGMSAIVPNKIDFIAPSLHHVGNRIGA